MKKLPLTVLFLSALNTVFGQVNASRSTNYHSLAEPEVYATYPGGTSQLNKYITDNVTSKVTFTTNESIMLRKAVARFIIDENGNTDSVSIVRSSNIPRLDSLFVSALKQMPKWAPATLNGKPIKQKWTYPLQICLK